MTTPSIRRGAAATGNAHATAAAAEVHKAGGNAVDAALAAQTAVMVSMPQAAGFGGDVLAIVKDSNDQVVGVNGTGKSASHWPTTQLAGCVGTSIAVPGAVQAIFDMHALWGNVPIDVVLRPALRLAEDGVLVDHHLSAAIRAQRARIEDVSPDAPLLTLTEGDRWHQPELATLLQDLIAHGPSAFYTGKRAAAISKKVHELGGGLSVVDLQAQTTVIGAPIPVSWNAGTVWVQPPVSQGVLLAMALNWLDSRATSFDAAQLEHVLVELTSACFGSRSDCELGAQLLERALDVDTKRATNRRGPRAYLHTAGVATADESGRIVSSLISVFDDFGSAAWVPEVGIFLNNRCDGFTEGANSPAPGKRPIHTLAPILVRDADGGFTALATPGADGQVQTLLQILVHQRNGAPLGDSIERHRWRSQDATLLLERDHPRLGHLANYGHHIAVREAGDDVFGAVVAAGVAKGEPFANADWRRQTTAAHYTQE
ncbi:gamma-glutamyltransferase [Rhodococcus sp. NPDC059968]|uniref:gamma-glutamyltransferase n=1 Tax=Rhodococcus sp. NPDC059968 TaxID=3347017 RepID=UPI0036732714